MSKVSRVSRSTRFRPSVISAAVAVALLSAYSSSYAAVPVTVKGVVAGSYFTPPVNSNNPALSTASSTAASVYEYATVCFDTNNNGVCDAGEPSTTSKVDGTFLLTSVTPGPLVAQISTSANNGGNPVAQRTVFRVAQAQIAAATVAPLVPVKVAVTPLSTEVLLAMEANGTSFTTERQNLATRLGVPVNEVLSDPNTVTDPVAQAALLKESVILTNRFALAAKMVDRGDISPAALAANPSATTPIAIDEAQQVSLNVEGIPRYDHIFIIMLENKATTSIKGSAFAPKINAYLNAGNQFISYFATGNPSEPNYTALGGADDFGITDDNQWNCGATGANALQDTVIPTNAAPGLAKSPFTNPCAQSTNHNITGRANLFNAISSNGLTWRTYSESMNPGQDFRTDSVADAAVTATDNVYAPGTVAGNTTTIGDPNLVLPLPAQLYRTKHHPGMAYQNVRSASEFNTSNRTLGGGQWDAALLNSKDYTIPAGYNIDQFGTDLQTGDIGNLNFVVPDQCDDMHGITVKGTDSVTGKSVTASDCSSVANNVPTATGGNIIARGDNYTDKVIQKIEASPIWQNQSKRVAIVIMFDEGNATSGFNSCCGWNPGNQTVSQPLVQNADGTFSVDTSVASYYLGNRGHGESVFGVLTNQPNAPKGIVDSDAYSHFSFNRTLQDMFGLADPGNDASYMNRSKYTQAFIAANILNLPEYASSADPHFDSVRPMSHAYVIPAGYTEKQSADVTTAAQTGPDATQINLWSLK
jgi:hypothetical protein